MGRADMRRKGQRRHASIASGNGNRVRTRPKKGTRSLAFVEYVERNGLDTSIAMIARYVGISRFTAYQLMQRWFGGCKPPEPIGPERQLTWPGPWPKTTDTTP